MTKGVRNFANGSFLANLASLPELGGLLFRRQVISEIIAAFEVSASSAATHYNHALKAQRLADPESVKGLGRAEDKKGGRKPVHLVDVIKVKTGEVVVAGVSKAKAAEIVAQAAEKKKSKLEIRVVVDVANTVTETAPEVIAEPTETVTA